MGFREPADRRPRAFILRGELVIFAADVAEAFEVETRQVVQNIKKNPIKLTARHAFELTDEDVEQLRSSGMMPKAGRGGSRSLPWVLTQKGVIRLATIMESPKALDATELIIDVFTEVVTQLVEGRQAITLANPSRVLPSLDGSDTLEKARRQIARAVDNLLDTPVDARSGATVREELGDVANTAIDHIKAFLSSRKISNEKIEAEAMLIVEQTRDIYERRQADLAGAALDRERKALDNFEKKIAIVERLLAMMRQLEPNTVIGLLPSLASPQRRFPPPGRRLKG